MPSMLQQIVKWVTQQKIWRFVCFVSSAVGLLCYALSSSFNHLFGKWNSFKVFLYSVFSFIICLTILFANTCHTSGTSLRVKAHLVFSIFTITTVYSFFSDKANGKPDLYSLISCAAFAITSLSLSKQTHLGFEIDLLYFFCGYLTLQLMKIKLFLVIVGMIFSYFLIILRFYLCNPTETGLLRLQVQSQPSVVIQVRVDSEESVVIHVNEDSEESNTTVENIHHIMRQEGINCESVPIINGGVPQENRYVRSVTPISLHSQQRIRDRDDIRLDDCKKELVQMNEKFNRVIWNEFMMKREEVFPDSYICTNTSNIKGMKNVKEDLHRIVKNMVEAGFRTECCNMYNIFRSKFLNKCLCRLGLQEFKLCDIEHEHIENLINAFHIALRILLPIERGIWCHIFSGFSPKCNIFSSSDWRRMEIELWAKFMVLETRYNRSHFFSNFRRVDFLGCGVHSLTQEVMNYIKVVSGDRDNITFFHIPVIIQLLKSNLHAKFMNYADPALGCIFMLNNIRYIQLAARQDPLPTILGDNWTQIQNSTIVQYIRDYIRCSWRTVLNLMKNNEPMSPNVAVESMRMFHLHFSNICNAQSTCFVVDEWLKETMRRAVKNMFLPLYDNFIGRFMDVLGEDGNQYIKYGKSDIEDRLKYLFCKSKLSKPSSSMASHHSH